ncbi:MAG: glutamyl-tRNA reductase [Pseudopedobacter saltans]|uniref:Glutamyl-tRNA reductase n=1 Tax=Pseudopedobacter saltans TaxID=151895 RepID=A0A2W5F872_9SPHI|nr:MAG: glutamyl-tRNA reductase [Pseudopedobacter saltans]
MNFSMDYQKFCVAGINYKKTDVTVRSQFAISETQYGRILQNASAIGLKDVFVIASCNRTEIYGIANSPEDLIELLCMETSGNSDLFREMAYIHTAERAMEHLFDVSAGLDSQILGDYEIVGQMKHAVQFAHSYGTIGAFSDRLINFAVKSSKDIKNKTQLSGGTTSVSFAAIQFLKWHCKDFSDKKILLVGAGKIATSTARNLKDYLAIPNLTIVNRTSEKAKILAEELGYAYAPFEQMASSIQEADVIITATNTTNPIINRQLLEGHSNKILIDLSIPYNIDSNVKEIPGMILVNVDELSKISEMTFSNRKNEIPAAKAIIREYLDEFAEWYRMRKNVPVLKVAKQVMLDIQKKALYSCECTTETLEEVDKAMPVDHALKKAINNMAVKLRENFQEKGCNCIQAINEFIAAKGN